MSALCERISEYIIFSLWGAFKQSLVGNSSRPVRMVDQ